MKKMYAVDNIDDTIWDIKKDFPLTDVRKISGIPLKLHVGTEDGNSDHFFPIYIGEKILVPYIHSGKVVPVYIQNSERKKTMYASLEGILVSEIKDLNFIDLRTIGMEELNYDILKEKIYEASNALPAELSEKHLLTAVKIGHLSDSWHRYG